MYARVLRSIVAEDLVQSTGVGLGLATDPRVAGGEDGGFLPSRSANATAARRASCPSEASPTPTTIGNARSAEISGA